MTQRVARSSRIALAAALMLAATACERSTAREHAIILPYTDCEPIVGRLRLSSFALEETGREGATHTTTWVNGPHWAGMEDNDLRGYLDGRFKYAWNQPGQAHVRIGRRGEAPRFGEYELFRVLHRWSEIALPPASVVERATLELAVELPSKFPVRLMLYEVKQDWAPGQGGTLHDNVSPPVEGEVWWNERAHARARWGLPGAGYASDSDPTADTAVSFLAAAAYEPGQTTLSLSSDALARYVTRRLAEGAPLLFLLKLTDLEEERPGSVLTVYSGNQGDWRNEARRPRLTLVWSSRAELETEVHEIQLEHGRTLDLPWEPSRHPGSFAWSFEPAVEGGPVPLIESSPLREEPERRVWLEMPHVVLDSTSPFTLRVRALEDPVALGGAFHTRVHDTWVRTAPPEEQQVPFHFVSPTGVEHVVHAQYQEDWTWGARFEPDELGPWRYWWTHTFELPYRSAEGRFDVVIGDRTNARRQLERFLGSLEEELPEDEEGKLRLMVRFSRLERDAVQLETPESFSSPEGAELLELLGRIRERLGGEPLQEPLPMLPCAPPEWARD